MTLDDLFEIALARSEWGTNLPDRVRALVFSRSAKEQDEAYWTLEGAVVNQGHPSAAAVKVVPALLASLLNESPRRTANVTELLFQIVWGNELPLEWNAGAKPASRSWEHGLLSEISRSASDGLWVMYRYAIGAPPGSERYRDHFQRICNRLDPFFNPAMSMESLVKSESDVSTHGGLRSELSKDQIKIRSSLANLQNYELPPEEREVYLQSILAAIHSGQPNLGAARSVARQGTWTFYRDAICNGSRTAIDLLRIVDDSTRLASVIGCLDNE